MCFDFSHWCLRDDEFLLVVCHCGTVIVLDYTRDFFCRWKPVACKDWLTNKVEHALFWKGSFLRISVRFIAWIIWVSWLWIVRTHSALLGGCLHLCGQRAGSQLAVAKALTNIVWTLLARGLWWVSLGLTGCGLAVFVSASCAVEPSSLGQSKSLYRSMFIVLDKSL